MISTNYYCVYILFNPTHLWIQDKKNARPAVAVKVGGGNENEWLGGGGKWRLDEKGGGGVSSEKRKKGNAGQLTELE